MFAAENETEEIVQILLDYNADIKVEDDDGETALKIATDNGVTKIVELINSQS